MSEERTVTGARRKVCGTAACGTALWHLRRSTDPLCSTTRQPNRTPKMQQNNRLAEGHATKDWIRKGTLHELIELWLASER